MATLVLTTIGTAVGGPIGGAIGAVIGSQLDQRLLAPRRQGRAAGRADGADLGLRPADPEAVRHDAGGGHGDLGDRPARGPRSKSGGGKGEPKTTSYSYSASFAVALSGAADPRGASDLGGRQAAARRGGRLEERDRASAFISATRRRRSIR